MFAAWIAVKEVVDNGAAGTSSEVVDLKGTFNQYLLVISTEIYLENYGVLMLHSLFEHWSVTKQALGTLIELD